MEEAVFNFGPSHNVVKLGDEHLSLTVRQDFPSLDPLGEEFIEGLKEAEVTLDTIETSHSPQLIGDNWANPYSLEFTVEERCFAGIFWLTRYDVMTKCPHCGVVEYRYEFMLGGILYEEVHG